MALYLLSLCSPQILFHFFSSSLLKYMCDISLEYLWNGGCLCHWNGEAIRFENELFSSNVDESFEKTVRQQNVTPNKTGRNSVRLLWKNKFGGCSVQKKGGDSSLSKIDFDNFSNFQQKFFQFLFAEIQTNATFSNPLNGPFHQLEMPDACEY